MIKVKTMLLAAGTLIINKICSAGRVIDNVTVNYQSA